MAVTTETLDLSGELRRAVGGQADGVTRAATGSWSAAWLALTPAVLAALAAAENLAAQVGHWPRPWEWSRIPEATNALALTTTRLDELTTAATTATIVGAQRAVEATTAAELAIINSQLPESHWIAATVTGAVGAGTAGVVEATAARIAATLATIPAETAGALTRALYRGPRPGPTGLVDDLRAAFLAGLGSVITTANTEILDAYRATSQLIHTDNSQVLDSWMWTCRLDVRVCPTCIALHGTISPLSTPGPIDHPHGRCQRLPLVKPWRVLGISDPEPESELPNARAWFATLNTLDQARILGPGRLALLDRGLISWDDLPRRRRTAGWRDSYRLATLRELEAVTASRDTGN